MPRGFCIGCCREIRRGVRCAECFSGVQIVPPRSSICVNRLIPSGEITTIFRTQDLAVALRWARRVRMRKNRSRLWIDASHAPARNRPLQLKTRSSATGWKKAATADPSAS